MHWLRIVLDEGHAIGTLAMTNRLQMAANLRAERRWVMTGTPAPSTSGGGGGVEVSYMQPLLAFLHDEALGGSSAGGWQAAVARPMAARADEGRWRLAAALRRCMIRASKDAMLAMPRLRRRAELLSFSPTHAASYNSFVDIVRFNLLTSDW